MTTYSTWWLKTVFDPCTGLSEKKLLSCEKVLPVCAWPVLSKTGLFFLHKPVNPKQGPAKSLSLAIFRLVLS